MSPRVELDVRFAGYTFQNVILFYLHRQHSTFLGTETLFIRTIEKGEEEVLEVLEGVQGLGPGPYTKQQN